MRAADGRIRQSEAAGPRQQNSCSTAANDEVRQADQPCHLSWPGKTIFDVIDTRLQHCKLLLQDLGWGREEGGDRGRERREAEGGGRG